ncbi:MAG: cellulase family glycosylhydrolase [Burkholderiales bacterium]|nr:cellulase family glycosylhydrolase [Anaerolineae bacterium]
MRFFHRSKVKAGMLALTLFFVIQAAGCAAADVESTPMPTPNPDSIDPFMGHAVIDAPFDSLTYSIQAFLWWNETSASEHLDWIKLMGFSHVKQIFAWEDLEPIQGEWHFERGDWIVDAVAERGLKLIARLSDTPDWAYDDEEVPNSVHDTPAGHLDDWANYCGAVAERYRGRIAAYQLWNEPNLAREWGGHPPNAQAFVDLLRVCSDAIRAADPDAILISGGLSPTGTWTEEATPDDMFFRAMYDAEFQQYVDVVGVHAPGFSAPQLSPAEAETQGRQRWATFRHVEDLRLIMVENGDAARQMAVLETGYTMDQIHPEYSWFAVEDSDVQGAYLVGAYQFAAVYWRPWVGLMSSIYIADPAWTEANEQYWWSITTPEGETRRSFIALANMAKFCGDQMIPPRDPGGAEARGLVPATTCD